MATKHIRVRLSFTHESDHQIEETTGAVITGMTGNKNYPNPPVDLAEVQAALTAFTAALTAQPSGGVHATADKNKKRRELVALCASSPVTFRATATTISPRCSRAGSRPPPPSVHSCHCRSLPSPSS